MTVKEPPGQSYAGKTVTFRIGEVQSGERRKWVQGGATVVSLNAYIQNSGPRGRVPGRFIRECVLNALGRSPSSIEDLTAQELSKAMKLCPPLRGRGGALRGGSDTRSVTDQKPAADVSFHIFEGEALLLGGPAEDGTGVAAFIDGVNVKFTRTRGGRFRLEVPQPPGQSFAGRIVEFKGSTAQGRKFDWLKSAIWTGGNTSIILGPDVRFSSIDAPGIVADTRPVMDQQPAAHIFHGNAIVSGQPAEDGTGVTAYIDGVRISGTKTNGGRFHLVVPQTTGQSFAGRMVEFRGSTAQGRRFEWSNSVAWTGGETSITLGPEVRFTSGSGQVGSPGSIPDTVTLECIRGVLGYLPAGPQEMTQEQRNTASGACPGTRGRMGQVLNPRAVDQSNQECAARVLGFLPTSIQAMTGEETRRVQSACFGGKPIPGARTAIGAQATTDFPTPVDASAPDRGPTRGFFINSASGEIGDLDKFMDPTMLAVLGILLTLLASSLSLVKGN